VSPHTPLAPQGKLPLVGDQAGPRNTAARLPITADVVFLAWCSVIATSFLTLEPAIVGVMVDRLRLSPERAGLAAAAQLASGALGVSLLLVFGRLVELRVVAAAGIVVLALADLASALVDDARALFFYRLLAGVAGGLILASVNAAVARYASSASLFGTMLAAQGVFGIIGYLMLPIVLEDFGVRGGLVALGACAAAALPFWRRFPAGHRLEAAPKGRTSITSPVALLLVSIFLIYVSNMAGWTYLERMGRSIGFDDRAVSAALALSLAGGLVGALAASLLGSRLSATVAARAGISIMALSTALFGAGLAAFYTGAVFFNAALLFVVPFYFAMLAAEPNGDRHVARGMLAIYAGLVAGPLVGSQLFRDTTFVPLIIAAVALALVAFALTWAPALRDRVSANRRPSR
jgi:predicted MFS family arabinose efflux permease